MAMGVVYQEAILKQGSAQQYPISGSFDFNLPSSGNPYWIYLTAQQPSLTVTLTVTPVLTAQTYSSTVSIPMTLTASYTTTITNYS